MKNLSARQSARRGLEIIQNRDLLAFDGYIGGAWIAGDKRFAVVNPADGETLAEVADLSPRDATDAIARADDAWPEWRARTAKERAAVLHRWRSLMLQNAEDLARIMTLEQGKPLAEARAEIALGASYVEWFAEEGKRLYGEVIPSHRSDSRLLVLRQPIGPAGAITPWNFPNAMITRKISPALAAGCPVVCKPPQETPLSALALARLAEQAELPPGLLNLVPTSDASGIGKALTADPRLRAFSFTGSTEVGKILMRQCVDTVKKVGMELGGNAPFIVFDDADPDEAVAGALMSKFRNAGQTCICPNRLLVQEKIYDDFAHKLAAKAGELRLGNGLDEDVQQGPLINAAAVQKVAAQAENARALGGRILCGGDSGNLGGNFFRPTVIAEADERMDLAQNETFGPLAPLFRFRDENDAIRIANATPFGLAAYVFTRDLGRAFRMSEALEYGMVSLNAGILTTELAPFGGYKESGLGREGARHGMDEYTEIKYVQMAGIGT